MEIIFTLIFLIGIGINSHRYEVRNQEVQQEVLNQEVTSFIEEETRNESNQLKVFKNTGSDIEINNELSEVIQNSKTIKMETKGKYISVRINDGNV